MYLTTISSMHLSWVWRNAALRVGKRRGRCAEQRTHAARVRGVREALEEARRAWFGRGAIAACEQGFDRDHFALLHERAVRKALLVLGEQRERVLRRRARVRLGALEQRELGGGIGSAAARWVLRLRHGRGA